MLTPRVAAPAFAASFLFFAGPAFADGLTPAGVQEALAKAAQSGKPLLAIAGSEN